MYQLLSHLGLLNYFPIVCGGVGQGGSNTSATVSGFVAYNARPLPGSVPGLYPDTNPLPPAGTGYVHRPVHMGTVRGFKLPLWLGFRTDGLSNKVVGRMFADHLLFLRSNNITPSKTYLSEFMEDWLRDWSYVHNRTFHDKVFAGMPYNECRHWNMPNTKTIRDQLKDLP